MNVDCSSNISKVISKYFTREHMDDSLSDFRETKKINSGPKISKAVTKKPRKTSKRLKGQKDIRSSLKAKKDELVTYTKKFDVFCRKSGIDVDPEQLELAVALSKSLQTEPLNGDCNTSTQEKSNRIRNTLQEYGFKVPKTKITTKREKKKHIKYKLLSCNNAQRLEIISDKFAQVLFQNVHTLKAIPIINIPITSLYYISTSISYEEIKNDEVFYVDELVDKSNNIGSLLRNWADIPGRPLSPVNTEYFEMNFNEIQCSQDELDIALSGSLKSINNMIKSKQNTYSEKNVYTDNPNNQISQDNFLKTQCDEVKIHIETQLLQHENRSCSPDIFEDEISIFENNKSNTTVCEDKLNDVMNLTECINGNMDLVTETLDKNPDCDIVYGTSINTEKSDNLMEITECVASTSRFNHEFIKNHVIDLTQNSNIKEITLIENRIENTEIDLTQSSNSSIELPIVDLPDKNSLDDTVTINACDYENIISKPKFKQAEDEQEILDLTQDCKMTESNEGNSTLGGIFDDYVYGHSDYSEEPVANHNETNDKIHNISNKKAIDEEKNVTKTTNSSNELNYNRHEILSKETSPILIDDIENKYSNIINNKLDKPSLDIINICETTGDNIISGKITSSDNSDSHQVLDVENEQCNSSKIQILHSNLGNVTKEIDLMQPAFDTCEAVHSNCQERRNSSLGKKDNISIDYDDICNGIKYCSPTNVVASSESEIHEIADEVGTIDKVINNVENDDASGLSQNSEVFEIVDNELNYSLFQSRYENFNTCGVSATNDISIASEFCDVDLVHGDKTTHHSIDLDNLPEVELNGTQDESVITSIRPENENVSHLENGRNGFIIKTARVSPMKDYTSMTTPERNKELDKYGIKPFKRKRAIQLLTYIYNQTHPIIDDNLDCVQSPPKKSKRNISPCSSSKKSNSPKKNNVQNLENIENIYEVTNEVPIIRELKCSVEDWVFQKREKAKVHSCRIPLHVAFHNYVSCRRGLREAILRYEPVNIDVIHKELVGSGHRYDPKDLLKFMDKKCITVKTTDNYGRNNKK